MKSDQPAVYGNGAWTGRNLPEYELIGHGLLEPTAQAFAERVADRYKVRAAIAASTEPG